MTREGKIKTARENDAQEGVSCAANGDEQLAVNL